MAVVTVVKPILPKIIPASATIVKAEISRVTRRYCERGKRELDALVGSWAGRPAPVVIHVRDVGNDIIGEVYIDDKILYFLDGGTHERWAFMSYPYTVKTSHMNLRSKSANNMVAIRGRGAMQAFGLGAQPGIAAREFSKALQKLLEAPWRRDIDHVMYLAVTRGQAVP